MSTVFWKLFTAGSIRYLQEMLSPRLRDFRQFDISGLIVFGLFVLLSIGISVPVLRLGIAAVITAAGTL